MRNRFTLRMANAMGRRGSVLLGMLALAVTMAERGQAAPIAYLGGDFHYGQTFDSLAGTVTWNDGATLPGWYLRASQSGFTGDSTPRDAIPDSLLANTGSTTTSRAYHFGTSGSSDRAIGWVNSSSTGAGMTGFQLQNQSGQTFSGEVRVSMNVEQWANRSSSPQPVELQYAILSGAGSQLGAAGWTMLSSGSGPTLSPTGTLNGNANAFTLSGLLSFPDPLDSWQDQQYLWFRLRDPDHSGTDNAYGIDNVSLDITAAQVSAVPEPGTFALLGIAAPLLLWRKRSLRSRCVKSSSSTSGGP